MNLFKNNITELNTIIEEVVEIETHLHSNERWFEKAAVPNGEIHVADRIGSGAGSFQIDAGNDDWGSWVQVLGSDDTPADTGKTFFDSHRAEFVSAERNATYFVQVAAQSENPNTQGITDVAFVTEFVVKPLSNQIDSGPIDIQTIRVPIGIKVWVRCMCPGQDTGTLNFYFGIHEYDE